VYSHFLQIYGRGSAVSCCTPPADAFGDILDAKKDEKSGSKRVSGVLRWRLLGIFDSEFVTALFLLLFIERSCWFAIHYSGVVMSVWP
jgi:hypothetical protein